MSRAVVVQRKRLISDIKREIEQIRLDAHRRVEQLYEKLLEITKES